MKRVIEELVCGQDPRPLSEKKLRPVPGQYLTKDKICGSRGPGNTANLSSFAVPIARLLTPISFQEGPMNEAELGVGPAIR